MSITPLAYLALVGWPLVVTVLFALMPGRKAVTIAVIAAEMAATRLRVCRSSGETQEIKTDGWFMDC